MNKWTRPNGAKCEAWRNAQDLISIAIYHYALSSIDVVYAIIQRDALDFHILPRWGVTLFIATPARCAGLPHFAPLGQSNETLYPS